GLGEVKSRDDNYNVCVSAGTIRGIPLPSIPSYEWYDEWIKNFRQPPEQPELWADLNPSAPTSDEWRKQMLELFENIPNGERKTPWGEPVYDEEAPEGF